MFYCFRMYGNKLFLYHVGISQNVEVVLMRSPWHIFMWRRRYWQIFKSALVYLWVTIIINTIKLHLCKRNTELINMIWQAAYLFSVTSKIHIFLIHNVTEIRSNVFVVYQKICRKSPRFSEALQQIFASPKSTKETRKMYENQFKVNRNARTTSLTYFYVLNTTLSR